MSENKDKFSLDDILNEYSPKASGGGVDVEDIINETNAHAGKAVETVSVIKEPEPEPQEEPRAEDVAEDVEEDISGQAEEKAERRDFRLKPIGGILHKLEEDAEELERAVGEDGSESEETAEEEPVSEEDVPEDEADAEGFSYDDPFGSVAEEEPPETESADTEEETAESGPAEEEKIPEGEPAARTRGTRFKFETDDGEDDGDKRPAGQSEYMKPSDAAKISAQIARLKSNLTVRAAVLLFASVFSLFITAANDLSLPLAAVFDRTVNPSAYLFTNTILGIISVGFSYSVIVMGIKSLINRRPDSDSVAALNMIAAIIAGLVTLFDPESLKASFFHLYTAAAIIGLLCNTLGKLCVVRRTQRNFEFVSHSENFSAVQLVDDDRTVAYLTNGSSGRRKELAVMRRTGFIKDFMKNSYSSDLADGYAEKTTPFMLAAALVVGLLSLVFEKNSAGASEKLFVFLASVSGTLSLCSSVALTLIVNAPLSRASKKLVDYSGVMLGYSSVEEFAEVNSVVIDAGHLFPTGTVEFVNLKMLGSTMIDEGIIYAASMASAGKSVTQPAFYKMLRGREDMLLPVKGCAAEDNMGAAGWIENKRVLLGSRELMEKHGVDGLPPEGAEESFADGNGVMYLAISGRAAMMFAVSLSVGTSAERWVQELEDESVEIHVRCSDGFITRELLAQMLDISPSSIRLLPSNCDGDCERIMGYEESVSASMFCSGHLPSFSMLLIAAKRLKFVANLGVAIQYGAMVIGILISLLMMITGSFAQITTTIVIIYNLVFLLLTYLMQSMKRL